MKKSTLLGLCGCIVVGLSSAQAAEFQFAVETEGDKPGKAFLWIPPDCDYIRGVLVCQQVILEAQVVNDPIIRSELAKEDIAIVHIVPSLFKYEGFDPRLNQMEQFQDILDRLAVVSGYSELSQAPVCWLGHSGGNLAGWNFGWWYPQRCFGVIGLHAAPANQPPEYDHRDKTALRPNIDYVPVLTITGQYECPGEVERSIEWHWRWCRGSLLDMRGKNKASYVSMLLGYGVGHFGWDEAHARYVGMFIRKAAHYRIPFERPAPGELPTLVDLPKNSGWLTDVTFDQPPNHMTAAYDNYTGDPTLAMWHLDEELARANDAFTAEQRGKKVQLVTFFNGDTPLAPAWMQTVDFTPEADGVTLRLKADFLDRVPPDLGYPGLDKIGHATGPIRYRLFGGWSGGGEQTGSDTFRIKFDRVSLTKGAGDLMVMAYHPGDEEYAYAEQPCTVKFPARNSKGKTQTINFAAIPDQLKGSTGVTLQAESDSGLPVAFCVISGPAVIMDNKLVLTEIPPRSKFPIKVTVAAYQWGRSIDPLIQTAEPVVRSFFINKNS